MLTMKLAKAIKAYSERVGICVAGVEPLMLWITSVVCACQVDPESYELENGRAAVFEVDHK